MGQTFDSLGKAQGQRRMDPMHMLQGLKGDPAGFMRQMGFNLPQGVDLHNPQAIVMGLLQSGQVSNAALRQGMGMMSQFPGKK